MIKKEIIIMIFSMFICIILITFLFIWRDLNNQYNTRILYDYHLSSILHAESIHAAFINLRPIKGIESISLVQITDTQSFASNARMQYRRIIEHSHSLLKLQREFDDPSMSGVAQRLNQAIDELYALDRRYESDPLQFAIELANQDLSIEIVSQQFKRLHQIAMKKIQQEIENKQPYIWLLEILLPILFIAGAIAVWRHNLRIIQREIALEEQTVKLLEENDKRLNEAQNIAQIGNWELDLKNKILYWSDEIFRIFEIDSSKYTPSYNSFRNLIHPEDREIVDKAINDSQQLHQSYNLVHRLLMPDGRIKHVRERGETEFDEDGKPSRLLGTIQDITYLHQIEKDLKSSDERMRLVLRATHDGIWDWNPETHEDYLSPRWKEIVGYRDDELPNIDSSFFELIHPEDQQAVKLAIERHLKKKEPFRIEIRLRHKDGSYKWILSRGEAVWDDDGKPLRMVGSITDITGLKKTQEELRILNNELEFRVQQRTEELKTARDEAERANRAKSEFLSRMSHELRTPMNAILGFSQLLEIEDLPSNINEYVHEIHRAGDHLLELINELLDLARVESGKMSVFLQPVNVNYAVKTAAEIVRPLMEEMEIRFVCNCNFNVYVMADATRLRQILVNLLSNAIKYNSINGSVEVSCYGKQDSSFLRITVVDTGPGISVEHQANLFTPFERLGAENSSVEGTGIGLALCKQLAELMGGKLGFECMVHAGKGSLFWLDLPIADEIKTVEVKQHDEENIVVETKQIIILYIEDNPANLRVVEGMLRKKSHLKLIAATSGEEGLKLARRFKPNVILLDIHLPGIDGYTVLNELTNDPETCNIPVVGLSADAMDIDVKRGLEAGFAYYLTKPVKMNTLFHTIDRCLEKMD